MSLYDPPSDPYGKEKHCRICDEELVYNWLIKEWECQVDHDEECCDCGHPASDHNDDLHCSTCKCRGMDVT